MWCCFEVHFQILFNSWQMLTGVQPNLTHLCGSVCNCVGFHFKVFFSELFAVFCPCADMNSGSSSELQWSNRDPIVGQWFNPSFTSGQDTYCLPWSLCKHLVRGDFQNHANKTAFTLRRVTFNTMCYRWCFPHSYYAEGTAAFDHHNWGRTFLCLYWTQVHLLGQ